MAIFYMIRHGEPDYEYCDINKFKGHGNDLAPLKVSKLNVVHETAKNPRIKDAEIIISSPYTRALETAAIISRELDLDIIVEPDVREWTPDMTYNYQSKEEAEKAGKEYKENRGVHPNGEYRIWETRKELNKRVMKIIDKYKNKHKKIILVAHGMAIESVTEKDGLDFAEMYQTEF